MPNAPTHDKISGIVALASTGAAIYYGVPAPVALLHGASVLFSGLVFSPDLDTKSIPLERWGPLKWLWTPYERALPHRHWLSHGPFIGTIFRLLYLFLMIALVLTVGLCAWQVVTQQPIDLSAGVMLIDEWGGIIWESASREQAEAVISGLFLGELAHIIPDHIVTYWRRRT